MTRVSILLLSTALMAGPALAADMDLPPTDPFVPEPIAPIQPVRDWTGFYVGIHGGGVFNPGDPGVLEFDGGSPNPAVAAAFGDNYDGAFDSGLTGGVSAGMDFQSGAFVFGGVVDLSLVDVGDRQSAYSATPAYYTQLRDLDFLATVRARAGFLATEDILVYGTGGVALGDVQHSFQTDTGFDVETSGGEDWDLGYTVGAGVETRVSDNMTVGVEYLYTNLGSSDYSATISGGPFGAGTTATGTDADFDFHTVRGTLRFSF